MKKNDYTAREVLEIQSSFLYFVVLAVMMVVAVSFLFMSKMRFIEICAPFIMFLCTTLGAFIVYRRKKNRRKAELLPWIIGLLTIIIPVLAKYNYGVKFGWTFALESYNSSMLIIVAILSLYLLYNKKLFITISLFGIVNWTAFIYMAIKLGASYTFISVQGQEITHGVILFREIFLILMTILMAYVCYRNIPIIDEFDSTTEAQRKTIEEQHLRQKQINLVIKDKVESLTTIVYGGNKLMTEFNDKMQNQSATFQQLSSTLEQLLASAENISVSSQGLVSGNTETERTLDHLRTLKDETRDNLEATLVNITNTGNATSKTTDSIRIVENTISRLQEQSGIIADTVSIIVDIADQINLLSLNASIEAARAGDSGRGFAVVADEIGKLATKTGESIKEISRVLSQSTATTDETVKIINGTATMVRTMIEEITQTSRKITTLQTSLKDEEDLIDTVVSQMVNNISQSKDINIGTEEQKNAIKNSAEAMEHVSEILLEMADEIQQLAGYSSRIFQNATDLLEISRSGE